MGWTAHRARLHRANINRVLRLAPVICSLIALAIVAGSVAAGYRRQADEGAAAHLFQLLIAVQPPMVIGFAATADWQRSRRSALVLIGQTVMLALALGSLAWSGY